MSNRAWVATRKGLFTIERGTGGRWSVASAAFVGDAVQIVLDDPRDGSLYAALGHGHFGSKLHRSRDLGNTWEEIACPAFPPKPDGVEDTLCPMRNTVIPWTLEQIWCLEIGGPDERGVLWCGTIPGGLFKSEDSGATWKLNEPLWYEPGRKKWFGGGYDLPGIHSICVDPRSARRVAVAVSCGGAWLTEDSGQTWALRADGMRAEYLPPEYTTDPGQQDPHRMVQCRLQPDALWVQHHNGIFATTDAMRSWSEIKNPALSGFGFAVAVHPARPGTAWFVPGIKDEKRVPIDGKLAVTRTRDGGKSFDVLREGLPQEHAYDIAYRHALDIDSAGDRLMFGSTTGSLWVSENQGDAWQTISANLPPVYCVRFAR